MMFSIAHKRKVCLFFLSLSWKHKLPATAISVHHWCIQRAWNIIEFIFKVWLLWVLLQLCAGILRKTGFFIFVYWKSWYKHTSILLGWSLSYCLGALRCLTTAVSKSIFTGSYYMLADGLEICSLQNVACISVAFDFFYCWVKLKWQTVKLSEGLKWKTRCKRAGVTSVDIVTLPLARNTK